MRKLNIVRCNRSLHAVEIFKQLGAREKGVERVYCSTKKDKKITVSFFESLSTADEDLFLVLLALVLPAGNADVINAETQENNLFKDLKISGSAKNLPSLICSTTSKELISMLKLTSGGENYKFIQSSLDRLSRVSFKFEQDEENGNGSISHFNLLSYDAIKQDNKIKEINFVLNPYSALAVTKNSYVLLYLNERFSLKSQAARRLHSVLCGLVNENKKQKFFIDTLSRRVFTASDNNKTIVKQRLNISRALNEINELENWTCLKKTGRGKTAALVVSRKKKEKT